MYCMAWCIVKFSYKINERNDLNDDRYIEYLNSPRGERFLLSDRLVQFRSMPNRLFAGYVSSN